MLAVGVAGCGEEKAAGKPTQRPLLSAAEFRTQANALCKRANKEMDAIGAGLTASSTEPELKATVIRLVSRTKKLADDIAALEEPARLTGKVEDMLASVRVGLDALAGASLEQLSSLQGPFAEANAKARKLGLSACAE
jgi:hypothetical protein